MRRRIFSALIPLLACLCAKAQTEGYRYFAKLDTVKASGFYGIEITSSINKYVKTDLSDLRIVNAEGKWVPHLIINPFKEDVTTGAPFPFRIITSATGGSYTEIVLDKSSALYGLISYIEVILRNTGAERWCRLSGSDDAKNWFVVQDSVLLRPLPGDSGKAIYAMSFPSCNYKLFRLRIDNKQSDPVNIITVQTRANLYFQSPRPPENNPASVVTQADSGRISYIKVTQPAAYHFDHISFSLKGAKYFYRRVALFIPADTLATMQNSGQPEQSIYLSNNNALEFNTALTNAKVFYIRIFNGDNSPLKMDSVITSFRVRYVTAYLDSGAHYRLLLGNPAATMPQYDLEHINKDSLNLLGYVHAGNISQMPAENSITTKKDTGKYLMWSAIIGALLVLLFFTRKMTKEIDKKQQS